MWILCGEKPPMINGEKLMALKRRLGLDSAYRPKPILRWHSGLQQKVKLLALDFENIDVNATKFLTAAIILTKVTVSVPNR